MTKEANKGEFGGAVGVGKIAQWVRVLTAFAQSSVLSTCLMWFIVACEIHLLWIQHPLVSAYTSIRVVHKLNTDVHTQFFIILKRVKDV